MNALTFALIASLVTLTALSVARALKRRARAKRFKALELRPNCLLTRHPIVFVSKQKSLFRVIDEWNDVPKYLREHGYDVMILTPVPGFEMPSVRAALDALPTKCHLLAGDANETLVERLAGSEHPNVTSFTLVRTKRHAPPRYRFHRRASVDDLKPLKSAVEVFEVDSARGQGDWQLEAKFLDHAISLAERDARWCD